MIAPDGNTRAQRASDGPAGWKQSMRKRFAMDGSDGGDGGDGSTDGSSKPYATVPIASLNTDGSGAEPQQGDKVDFNVEGTVDSVQGGMVKLTINTIDGESVGDGGDAEDNGPGGDQGADESTEQMGNRLRQKASMIQ